MSGSVDINIAVWERLYSEGKSILQYPDSTLVSLGHYLLKPQKQRKILDYGFGSGSNLLYFLRRGFVCSGAEVSKTSIKIASDRIAKEGFNAELRLIKNGVIPFGDGAFDAVIAWQVLYYNDWDNLADAVSEIDRVLKKGGLFLGTMAAPGDASQKDSCLLGDNVYKTTAREQKKAIVMIVDKDQLSRCFPHKNISVGKFGYDFNGRHSCHWVVSYKK